MSSTTTDQINGFSGSTALKQPVRLATTAPVTLEGLAAIDGVVPAEGDRILVKDQADASQNGIYIASSGVWSRAVDIDATGKVVKGTQVWATDGVSQPGTLWFVTAANPIVLGATLLTWQIGSIYQAAAAMAVAIAGAANKATPVAADKFPFLDDASGTLRQFSWTQMLAALALTFLPLAGGTLTGNLSISKNTPLVVLNKSASGQANYIQGQMGGAGRWLLTLGDITAEGGANAGSDFSITRYNDAGVFQSSPIAINRASGAITLNDGQLKFPATQNPSSDANTLDDYEEGTWTPALTFGGAAVGMTATAQTLGRYTKIGNMVAVYFRHQLSAKGSSTGTAVIGGLPFTSNNFSGGPQYSIATGQIDAATFASLVAGFDMAIGSGGTSISLRNRSTTGQSGAMSEANFTNSSGFGGSGVYMV